MLNKLQTKFQEHFNCQAKYLVKSPGRVNLIGEHTDYNDGFVLPMAIDRHICLAFNPRTDQSVNIYSMDFQNLATFSLNNLQKGSNKAWVEYIKGVAWTLQEKFGPLKGFDGVIYGDIPQGAGLSSSAAIELATARVLATSSDLPWNGADMAKIGQIAENKWVGVNCGIMDQMAVALGLANHALLIDCRNLHTDSIILPKNVAVVIMDTNTRRELVDSAYNERRQQCEQAAHILGVSTLRDVSAELWQDKQHLLQYLLLKRARHVITENQRVIQATEAMQKNDAIQLGRLMNASHESLREDFEVSSQHLDIMVNCARDATGCYGARMTGAGFGGCAVALVKEMYADDFVDQVTEQYEHLTKLKPMLYVTQAMDGVTLEKIET